MTAVRDQQSSRVLLWAGLGLLAAVVVFLAFAGQDDPTLGGPGDPIGTGPDGLGALRTLIEEAGGTPVLGVGTPDPSDEVAVLATAAYIDLFAEFEDREDRTIENYEPVLEWVRGGGTLVAGVDVPGGPEPSGDVVDRDDTVGRSVCDVVDLEGVTEIRPLEHRPVAVKSGDRSCFGDGETAVLVVRDLGRGQIARLASIGVFSNRALDDADNAALAARLFDLGPGRVVAFLSGPAGSAATTGPVNEEGEPVGAGDSGLFELVPDRVLAMMAGLASAAFIYALARGRRLGSPVDETTPIELPSSSFVEAVGRLYARSADPRGHSSRILRSDFRSTAARRLGMPPDSSADVIAGALGGAADERASLIRLLDDAPPSTDDDLVDLAGELADRRFRVERGGLAELMTRPRPDSGHDDGRNDR